MTNHWNDIANSDVIMIIGSNAAENHPISFKFVQKAMDKGAKLIVVDPRYTRSAAKASIVDGKQLYSKMRSGTDIAFMLGMMKYAVDNNRYNSEYVKKCTNAPWLINAAFETCRDTSLIPGGTGTGTFSGLVPDPVRHKTFKYDKTTWGYQFNALPPNEPLTDYSLVNPDTAWQNFVDHIAAYDIAKVSEITGADQATIQKIYEVYTSTYLDDKSACIMYAMGSTQHTYGSQNVRSYAMMQLLLGNAGVAGGGINALRGESNVQGSTDMCLLWHILPGYLAVTNNSAGKKDRTAYKNGYSVGKAPLDPTPTSDPVSLSWWKFGGKYIDSLIQAWWPIENNPAYVPGVNESTIMDYGYSLLPKADSARWYTHA
jgi:formate dehydrogenase major subunit